MNDISYIKNDLMDIILMMEIRKAAVSAIAHGGVVSEYVDGFRVDCGSVDSDLVSRRIARDVKGVVVAKISDKILSVSRVGRR